MKKIGFLSGTFDPIHNGHLALAKTAKEQAGLDKVVILVEQKPRRKTDVTDYKHRLKMCQLASQNYDWLDVLELNEEKFTTSETLPKLKELFPDAELNLIVGSDLFAYLPNWPKVWELTNSVRFIVSIRDGHNKKLIDNTALGVDAEFTVVENKLPNVSSSKVRSKLSKDEAAEVDESVSQYAAENKLYKL